VSRENVEIVRAGFEAWSAGDFERMMELVDPEIVTRRVQPMPDAGTWHGADGMLEATSEWVASFDDFAMEPGELTDAGDHVIAEVRQEGRSQGAGVPVTGTFWFVFGLRGRKVVSLDMCATRDQAEEVARG
jgi:ketosteroid isomerase-like protein